MIWDHLLGDFARKPELQNNTADNEESEQALVGTLHFLLTQNG